jgi:hypothetical protein
LKGILPANQSLYFGDRLGLLQRGLFFCVKETHVSLQRNPSLLETAAGSTMFPGGVGVEFERNTFCKSIFSRLRKAHFFPNRPVQLN